MKRLVLKTGLVLFMMFLFINVQSILSCAASGPDTPTAVRVWRYSNTKLRLKWNGVKNADGYIIYKYNKVKKKYNKYKTINNSKTRIFIDEIGNRTSAKYRISSFQKEEGKKMISRKSHVVFARTYKQGDKKVNAGQVKVKITNSGAALEHLAYYETISAKANIKSSTYSKAKGKKTLSTNVRWYSSNPKIAKVDRKGVVIAKALKGKCNIYARAHNGRKSNNIVIQVKNYAKPPENSLNLSRAYQMPGVYGFVLELFTKNYKSTTDIAEYFYINRPVGNDTFKCWMEDGEIKMQPDNYLSETFKQKMYKFVKDFPYDIRIYITSDYVEFTQMEKHSEGFKVEGPNATFLYDRNKHDPKYYDEKNNLTTNWVYGVFTGR